MCTTCLEDSALSVHIRYSHHDHSPPIVVHCVCMESGRCVCVCREWASAKIVHTLTKVNSFRDLSSSNGQQHSPSSIVTCLGEGSHDHTHIMLTADTYCEIVPESQ